MSTYSFHPFEAVEEIGLCLVKFFSIQLVLFSCLISKVDLKIHDSVTPPPTKRLGSLVLSFKLGSQLNSSDFLDLNTLSARYIFRKRRTNCSTVNLLHPRSKQRLFTSPSHTCSYPLLYQPLSDRQSSLESSTDLLPGFPYLVRLFLSWHFFKSLKLTNLNIQVICLPLALVVKYAMHLGSDRCIGHDRGIKVTDVRPGAGVVVKT